MIAFIYCKVPIIILGPVFVQKALLLGLFSGELIFGGAYSWRNFVFQNGLGLTTKTAENTNKTALNSLH